MIIVFIGAFVFMFSPYSIWIMTALFLTSYPPLHLIFYKNRKYKHLEFNNQMYVISKRIQSVVEFLLLPYIVVNWGWHTENIRNAALVYASPHVAALIMCNYSYIETLQHAVIIMLALVFQHEDFLDDSAARCGVIYGCFSCLSFWVHYVLAERHMRRVSVRFDVFLGVCVCNWFWQLWYLIHHSMNLWGVVWVSCLVVLINNDIIILKRWVE